MLKQKKVTSVVYPKVHTKDLLKFYKYSKLQIQADFGFGLTQDIDYLWRIHKNDAGEEYHSLRFDCLKDFEFWLVLNEDCDRVIYPRQKSRGKKHPEFFIQHLCDDVFTIKDLKNPKFFMDLCFF